jgi:hypothetical protein
MNREVDATKPVQTAQGLQANSVNNGLMSLAGVYADKARL